jgi:ketosteroid isomerase-like protein
MADSSLATEELAIRELLNAKVAATRHRNVDGATSAFAPDAVSFDVVDPLYHTGADAVRRRVEAWFSSFRGPIDLELHGLRISVGPDIAFAHSLNHASGDLVAGGRLDMWWRETLCLERRQGRWVITHAHDSVPFNPESGKPSLSLKP